jgi:hypothetical protein
VNYSPAFIHVGEVRQSSPPGRMQAPHPPPAWYSWLKELTPPQRRERDRDSFKMGWGGEVVVMVRQWKEGRGGDYALHPRSTLQDVSLPFMHDVDLHPSATRLPLPLLLRPGLQRLLTIQIRTSVTPHSEPLSVSDTKVFWCVSPASPDCGCWPAALGTLL